MNWKKGLVVASIFVWLMWMIHLLQTALGVHWVELGVFPRKLEGIYGVLTSPLIHGSFHHLFSNSIPIFMLTFVLFLAYRRSAEFALIMVYIGTGLGIWIFARPSYHIGASGVVYGLIAFLFWTGVFRKSFRSIALSLAILFLYGGYVMGILPDDPGVSWDGHLIGGVVGIIVAFILRGRIEEREKEDQRYTYLEEEEPQQNFFDPDVFDKRLEERDSERYSDWK